MGPKPTPLKVRGDSHKIIKNPPLAPPHPQPQPPQTHQQEPSQSRPPPGPVNIYTVTPRIIHTHPNNFMTLVQRLTGKTSTSTTSSSSSSSTSEPKDTSKMVDTSHGLISPAARFAVTEKANTSNELGTFVGGEGTMDQYYHHHHQEQPHQNRGFERPSFHHAGILSPGPYSLPAVSPDFFSTIGPTDPQEGTPYLIPSGDMHSYLSQDEDRGIPHSVKDTRSIGSAYDRYLQSMQTFFVPSEEAGPFNGVGMVRQGGSNMMPGPSMGELMAGCGGSLPSDFRPNGRDMGFGQLDSVGRPGREPHPLPPDVSNTLYVEGLPSNCSRREVSHIFRPFVGYREVRLVTQDSKHRSGDPTVLCFVDFENSACAATALSALQDYRMDEDEPDSKILRLQFFRNPGPRPGQRGGRR
ncbi:unnamed protein product [Arabidopsis thaliana]|uniref:RRM domain-containing protein n=2 Tax=Arabidopsis thaliana TaxID=3702 RepID=A0A654EBN3_ARATH|nr:unnamed protein product [Arabidopsis thaliana]